MVTAKSPGEPGMVVITNDVTYEVISCIVSTGRHMVLTSRFLAGWWFILF
jgi:hypothetical protein